MLRLWEESQRPDRSRVVFARFPESGNGAPTSIPLSTLPSSNSPLICHLTASFAGAAASHSTTRFDARSSSDRFWDALSNTNYWISVELLTDATPLGRMAFTKFPLRKPFALRCRLRVLVRHMEIAVAQVVADCELTFPLSASLVPIVCRNFY